MKTFNPKHPLFSIHIPKCAGNSFSGILHKWFRHGYLRHYPDERSGQPPKRHRVHRIFPKGRFRSGICIHGHFNNERGYGVRDYYPHADQLITVLRDPFELHISNYFFVKRAAVTNGTGAFRAGQPHPIIANRWTLSDYLINRKVSHVLKFLPPELSDENYQKILDEQFLYIGIAEQLQQSVDILANILAFPTFTVPYRNVSERTEAIPNGAREEFEANNALEMKIYRYALTRWGNSQSCP